MSVKSFLLLKTVAVRRKRQQFSSQDMYAKKFECTSKLNKLKSVDNYKLPNFIVAEKK